MAEHRAEAALLPMTAGENNDIGLDDVREVGKESLIVKVGMPDSTEAGGSPRAV